MGTKAPWRRCEGDFNAEHYITALWCPTGIVNILVLHIWRKTYTQPATCLVKVVKGIFTHATKLVPQPFSWMRLFDVFSQWSLSFCSRLNMFAHNQNILKCRKSKTFTLSDLIFVVLEWKYTQSFKFTNIKITMLKIIQSHHCRIIFNLKHID